MNMLNEPRATIKSRDPRQFKGLCTVVWQAYEGAPVRSKYAYLKGPTVRRRGVRVESVPAREVLIAAQRGLADIAAGGWVRIYLPGEDVTIIQAHTRPVKRSHHKKVAACSS